MSPAPWNSDPEVDLLQDGGHNQSIMKNIPMRPSPIIHPGVDTPICPECQALDMTFFNPECFGCQSELRKMADHGIGIASIMAVLRQWIPQVQQSIEYLVDEALRMGAHPDDRDGVTDMTLLMYTCKAGAAGVGDGSMASKVAQRLIDLGASLKIRCRWTNMTPLHYASYFDVSPVLKTLLKASKGTDVDTTCAEYENGTALHIAAANLGVSAVRILLNFGADSNITDDLARKPLDCVPEMHTIDVTLPTDDVEEMILKLRQLLSTKGKTDSDNLETSFKSLSNMSINGKNNVTTGRSVMHALGLKIGDRVFVNGNKLGTLQFCGTTEFAGGIWAGIVLDDGEGKNDGSVKGVSYFKCLPEHGVFVPPNKISKVGKHYRDPLEIEKHNQPSMMSRPPMTKVNHGKVDVSKVSPRIHEAMTVIAEKGKDEIRVGDRVLVEDLLVDAHGGNTTSNSNNSKTGSCFGTVRFIGRVDFVEGDNKWFGIELDEPKGRHDGTVQDVRYFAAPDDHGVFVTESKISKLNNNFPVPPKNSSSSNNNLLLSSEDGNVGDSNTFSMNYHTLEDSLEQNNTNISSENLVTSAVTNTTTPTTATASPNIPNTTSLSKPRPLRRSLSMQHRAAKITNGPGPDPPIMSRPPSSVGPNSLLSTPGLGRKVKPLLNNNNNNNRMVDGGWQSVGAMHPNKFQMKRPKKKYIEPGTSVICIHTKEMAVIKYVGRTGFASGIWIGLELRNAKGKHDGQVGGRRYFTCKPNHGVMIRPKMVSVHGINGEDLLKPETEYPF